MATYDIDPCRGTLVLENEKFAKNSDGKTVVRVADDDLLAAIGSGPLAGINWDAYTITYNSLTDVVEYYEGGVAGTILITFTATYQTTRKKKVLSGVWV
ncbi:MAG: hypothetical protein DRQ40_09580 [Gammaproteobacteria bacterium]|nr:MAG: hypothetical protein DRQ40_09580 [Gammaproteobacteria bacterium]